MNFESITGVNSCNITRQLIPKMTPSPAHRLPRMLRPGVRLNQRASTSQPCLVLKRNVPLKLNDIRNYLPWIFGIAGFFRIDEKLFSCFNPIESKSSVHFRRLNPETSDSPEDSPLSGLYFQVPAESNRLLILNQNRKIHKLKTFLFHLIKLELKTFRLI